MALVEKGQLAEAETLCLAILEQAPDAAGHQMMGFIAHQTARHDLTVQHCTAANRCGLTDWSNDLRLGRSLLVLGQRDEAFAALRRSCTLSPTNIEPALLLLDELMGAGYEPEAAALYGEMLAHIADASLARHWQQLKFTCSRSPPVAPEGMVICAQMTARHWAERAGGPVMLVEGVDDIPAEAPHVIGSETPYFRATTKSNDPYVAELRDVSIFSKSNIVLTRDGFALNEPGAHPEYGTLVSHRSDAVVVSQRGNQLLVDTRSYAMQPIDTGIMMSGVVSDAFGHWCVEYLPRLQFYEHHPDYEHLPIIVDEAMPQSHFDYLACIAKNPLIRLPTGAGFTCECLIYAPPATFFPVHMLPNDIPAHEIGPVSPRSYRYLKARVEASLGTTPPQGRKYFLSRRSMTWRRLANDAEIAAFLEARGYVTIEIETLTFAEQVRLFQSASHIVASNGSALQNIIFSDPSVQLIILSQSNLVNWGAFYAQTGALGYESVFVTGTSVGDASQKHSDYIVPLSILAEALGEI